MAVSYLKKTKLYNIFKDNFHAAVLGSRYVLGFKCHLEVPKMNHVDYEFFRGAEWIKYYISVDDDDLVFILYRYGGFFRFHVDVFDFDKGCWSSVYDNKGLSYKLAEPHKIVN